jgi:hypothetical protein
MQKTYTTYIQTWGDSNIDSTGPDGNVPYAYSLGIQSRLK